MKLWIGNIAPGTPDEEIRELVKKYASDLECTNIRRVEGDGSRPAAVLEFAGTPYGSVLGRPSRNARAMPRGARCPS